MYHSKQMPVKEIKEATGVSTPALYRSLKAEQTSKRLALKYY